MISTASRTLSMSRKVDGFVYRINTTALRPRSTDVPLLYFFIGFKLFLVYSSVGFTLIFDAHSTDFICVMPAHLSSLSLKLREM